MAKERISRHLIRRLEAQRKAILNCGGWPTALREIYDDQLTGFGVRIRGQKDAAITFRALCSTSVAVRTADAAMTAFGV